MHRTAFRFRAVACAVVLVMSAAPSWAIAPALLMLVKSALSQAAESMVKDTLMGALSGMGCKGIAIQNAIAALNPGAIAQGVGVLPPGVLPGGIGQTAGGNAEMADMLAQMKSRIPGGGVMPPGETAAIADAMKLMGKPTSPLETAATIDALAEVGFLTPALQSELKLCLVVVPAIQPALGMAMAMFKPMLPELQQARAELRALSPAEQDELIVELAAQVKEMPASERAAALEFLNSGFLPPRVAAGIKAAAR